MLNNKENIEKRSLKTFAWNVIKGIATFIHLMASIIGAAVAVGTLNGLLISMVFIFPFSVLSNGFHAFYLLYDAFADGIAPLLECPILLITIILCMGCFIYHFIDIVLDIDIVYECSRVIQKWKPDKRRSKGDQL